MSVATLVAKKSNLLVVAALLSTSLLLARYANKPDPITEGAWLLPTGGPYNFGLLNTTDGQLWVNDKLVVPCGESYRCRHVMEAGVYSFRQVGTGVLVWHPPGRRGHNEYEYVPQSSLSDAAPESATFIHPGTYRSDAWWLLALLAVWLATFVMWHRRWILDNRCVVLSASAIFFAALLVRLIGLESAGQTWDEDVNWSAGRNYIQNLLNGDFSPAAWHFNYQHPPLTKYFLGVSGTWSADYASARLATSVLSSLTAVVLVFIGQRLFSLRAGLFSGAMFALTPHVVGHARICGHETMSLFLWAMLLWLCVACDFNKKRSFVWLGFFLGLAVLCRFSNGIVFIAVGVTLLLGLENLKQRVVRGFVIVAPVTALTVFVLWPRLWHNPLSKLSESVGKLTASHGVEPYHSVFQVEQPWYYFFDYFWATTPVIVLVLMLPYCFFGKRHKPLLLLWILIPFLIIMSPVKQDGVRYVLPAVLGVCLVAGRGLDLISQNIKVALVASFFCFFGLVVSNYKIHPYQIDYYGMQVGGVEQVAANNTYEVAWWGEGLDKSVEYINEHAEVGDEVLHPWACVEPNHMTWLRHDLWKPTNASRADWFLVYAPHRNSRHPKCIPGAEYSVVFEEKVQGVTFSRVYKRSVQN